MTRLAAAIGLLIPILLSAPEGADRSPDTIDVSRFPPKYQRSYQVFEVKCSKCHPLAKAINGNLSQDFWRSYIKKMSRRPGSGINERNGEVILDFIFFYSRSLENPDAGRP